MCSSTLNMPRRVQLSSLVDFGSYIDTAFPSRAREPIIGLYDKGGPPRCRCCRLEDAVRTAESPRGQSGGVGTREARARRRADRAARGPGPAEGAFLSRTSGAPQSLW